MSVIIVTGSAGLVGSATVRAFGVAGYDVVGVDNDLRSYFFGAEASTRWNRDALGRQFPGYQHAEVDIRDRSGVAEIFRRYGKDIVGVVHTAAQPSHDWAAREPFVDFDVNAVGTLNLLEATRLAAPDAVFVFTSTNKVYGDTPNLLPLRELETRWEIEEDHPFQEGIDESMSIDQTKHSLFGASKVAADVLVQEYGRYFGMKTACFRGGCITGPQHSGAPLHGFLAYLMRCAVVGTKYTVIGYGGKQVRDNIHAEDLAAAFMSFFQAPRAGEVYNIGGGRESNCSVLEAIRLCEEITGKPMNTDYRDENRIGDHIWWITDCGHFRRSYPDWTPRYSVRTLLEQMYQEMLPRLEGQAAE